MSHNLTVVGFTGTRDLTPQQQQALRLRVRSMPRANEYVTGACVGVDATVGEYLLERRPGARHHVIVPADRSRVVAWWRKYPQQVEDGTLHVFEMPPASTYADRNLAIVTYSTALIAVPAWPEDHPRSQRSGTWQTVRMARRKGIAVDVWMVDELAEGAA